MDPTSATTGAGAIVECADSASTRPTVWAQWGRNGTESGTRTLRRASGSSAHGSGRCSRHPTGRCSPPPERNRPTLSWQLTVRSSSGTKRRCTPTEWFPRLGSTAGTTVHARGVKRPSIQRTSSCRVAFQSQGLALTNCWSDCEAVADEVTVSAMRRTDFLPRVASSPRR